MLKYTISFKCFKGDDIRIEIDSPTYTGEPIQLEPTDQPLIKEYQGNSDDDIFKAHCIHSTMIMQVFNTNVDIDELMYISDASFKCRVYINSVLDWQGFIISDGIQEVDSGVAYPITIKAIDGVQLLDNVKYEGLTSVSSVTLNDEVANARSIINFLRISLFDSLNLDNRLPIRWNSKLKSKQYPESDMICGLNRMGYIGELLLDKTYSNLWYLENFARVSHSWLYQKNGYWYFNNYFDALSGTFNGYQITSVTNAPQTATVYNEDELQEIAMSDTINQSWWWGGKKPLGSVSVRYNSVTLNNNNVIPNGGFDEVSIGPVFWYLKNGLANQLTSTPPLNNEYSGNSVQVRNTNRPDDWLTFGSIPVDTNILFKEATFGFTFVGLSGYDVDAQGVMNVAQVRAVVKYVGYQNGVLKNLYLNEFGYWVGWDVTNPDGISISNVVTSESYGRVFINGTTANAGQIYNVRYSKLDEPRGPLLDVNRSYTFPNDTPYATAMSQIATATGGVYNGSYIAYTGYKVYSFQVSISDQDDVPTQINFSLPNVKMNDIVSIQFQSKGLSAGIKLPDCGDITPLMAMEAGRLSIELYSKGGTIMQLDDAYFRVNDNKDVYELQVVGSKNSREEYSLDISSSFSGNMVSNIMDGYADSNKSLFWNDDKTLTELYGTRILNWRNKPRKIFSGQIDKVVEWGLFELKGLKYAPLSIKTDYVNGISIVTGIEIGENVLEYEVTHKSSGAI